MMKVCVLCGNLSYGFCSYGPFDCETDAVKWAGIALDNADPWQIVAMFSPDE